MRIEHRAAPVRSGRNQMDLITGQGHSTLGTVMAVSSPARCSLAGFDASRRSVFTRSPARTGMSDGATTSQTIPMPVSSRCSSKPHGPAS